MKGLKGSVVLIDFWTYSCVNCIRALPHLREWNKKYSEKGLVIIGVHTPEFEFEKNLENVSRAVKNFGIEYPVVMDNDYQIWSLYSNQFWPRKFLINKDGQIVYDHAGEGNYKETERQIQKALLEIDPELKLPPPSDEEGSDGICYPVTPETYLGAMRGRTGKTWSFKGLWKVYPEFIEHGERKNNFEDYLELNFEGTEVNLVMESLADQPVKIRLELDGKFLREVGVHEAKMYNLVLPADMIPAATARGGRGQLKIFSKDQGLRAYAFTFGGCA
ncbi:MAG: redoxin family protein [Candidatus Liptonbacteria bacterium]|nr:redoxin family protein [Candidatus Liptonbacteria bacterium]